MLPNITITTAHCVPEPQLNILLEKLTLVRPSLKFIHDASMASWRGGHSYLTGRRAEPDAPSHAMKFKVTDNGAPAGYVFIESNYSRRTNVRWRIGVQSHLISNLRGRQNVTYSASIEKALFNAKKFLVAQSYGYILFKKYSEALSTAAQIAQGLARPLARGAFLTNTADAQILLHSFITGRPVDPALLSAARAKIDTPQFEKALSEFHLMEWWARAVNAGKRVYIHNHELGYMMYLDKIPNDEEESHKAPVRITTYEELPEDVQNRLAVLQLMSDTELVKDVGMRVSSDSFWVYV